MRGRIVVLSWVAVAALFSLLLACDGVQGQDESKGKKEKSEKKTDEKARAKPEAIKATGTISVTKDEKGKVTDATFASDDGKSYKVLGGKKFEKLDGKKVEIVGMAAEKDGEMLLKISKCKEAKEEEKTEKGDKEEKPEQKKKPAEE
ncbi:MAG: hypothetical protein AB1696_05075 [Planctomycetota bacterium]